MSKEISDLDIMKNEIVYNLFVDTADQNYVVARWCYQNSLDLDFFWNGAHALEKFMKAALLLNGKSAIKPISRKENFSHNISKLYEELKTFAADLLPEMLIQPNEIDVHWHGESVDNFVSRLSACGDPNNRYQIFGYAMHIGDIYKFDRLVFAIRRLCCPLEKYFFGNTLHEKPDFTYREVLLRQAEYMPRDMGSRFSKLIGNSSPSQVREAALNHNILFAPESYQHGEMRNGTSSLNSVLWQRIIRVIEQRPTGETAREIFDFTDWVLSNIFLPKEVKLQIEEAREKLIKSLAGS